jgi:glucosamine--fructose-6-phosphate aminotransferase (isomerizing)
MNSIQKITAGAGSFPGHVKEFFSEKIFFGRTLARVPAGAIVFFPVQDSLFGCGIAGIVARVPETREATDALDLDSLVKGIDTLAARTLDKCTENKGLSLAADYMGGSGHLDMLLKTARDLKNYARLYQVYATAGLREALAGIADRAKDLQEVEAAALHRKMGILEESVVDQMSRQLEKLKDFTWCLQVEILGNLTKIKDLSGPEPGIPGQAVFGVYSQINTVLNSIGCLEVRGRDSAGISVMLLFDQTVFDKTWRQMAADDLQAEFTRRCAQEPLINRGIRKSIVGENDCPRVAVTLTYKIAAEIGSLGDNLRFLRQQVQTDQILLDLVQAPLVEASVLSHTRWASVGAITEANCHPVDNHFVGDGPGVAGTIQVCLNGDIDNYQQLKERLEKDAVHIEKEITSDTKVIPLQIQNYLGRGDTVEESFRKAVNDFDGSHAISMHTDLAPGKLFCAQRGSGQAIFIGLAPDHYIASSEVYGFIEATQQYLKIDGETQVPGKAGTTQGQVFVLDREDAGDLAGIKAMYYDGTPVPLSEESIKTTDITSRDINRQGYAHYFLKEISEAPDSVLKTLDNRWKIKDDGHPVYTVTLDEKTFPADLARALREGDIKRIFLVGQGTAGIAAKACANIINTHMADPRLQINALKASELSGFRLTDTVDSASMADTLVIAISQSGTTTDTNKTVDMVRARGARLLAIVNRRDSDLTFKVDGVMYTSSGRDLEMSVASTKAFYAQIIAGSLLGLHMAAVTVKRSPAYISAEIEELLQIPRHMRTVLAMSDRIKASASRLAAKNTYWAAVGSGPNKASADEIRIKLSELCYKTISSDYVEDKKHIDLSSEPLILVCAAGTRESVLGDIIKDTAIFQAHKATPVVIANEGETRFDPYAADVFPVPAVSEHLAPIVNTLVGHIWGYFAALAINEGSRFLYGFQEELQQCVDTGAQKGLDVYELILEKSFREKIGEFYKAFRKRKSGHGFPVALGLSSSVDLTLLMKYLSGRLPVSDFELDFGIKGTARNMLNTLFESLGKAINDMSRPVDAIKHQAKTVTVGTSRLEERLEGLLFDTLSTYGFIPSQLINRNVLVLKNVQPILSEIKGAIHYRIGGLNLLGEPVEDSTIEVLSKSGTLEPLPSRVETDNLLKGTKRIIVREGNVFLGKGKKDNRNIIVIPIISLSPATPNMIEPLLLLHIGFREDITLAEKIKALGGKYERIKNIVQEDSVAWNDDHLEIITPEDLFGISAEKIGELIVNGS